MNRKRFPFHCRTTILWRLWGAGLLLLAAWTGADVGYPTGKRSLHLDLVTFEGDKPVTNGPSSTPQLFP